MDRASEIRKHYSEAADTKHMWQGTDLLGIVTTDSLMTCYARYMAHVLSEHAPTYLSTFLVAPHASEMNIDKVCVTGEPHGAACHAGDVGFFLPITDRMSQRTGINYATKDEKSFAQAYTQAIVNFGADVDTTKSPFVVYNASKDESV